jgi:hypothetical protein
VLGVVAVEAIVCAAAAYGFLFVPPTFCGGANFLKCVNVFDFVFAGLFIFCVVLFGDDRTNICAAFGKKYFDANSSAPVYYDCGLIGAVFALCIILTCKTRFLHPRNYLGILYLYINSWLSLIFSVVFHSHPASPYQLDFVS